ncbi:hypothetical protein TNCV_2982051 [Trichonephila clavipes]|nr:hypothetical protein TNCV_2982051 [Trichonephila clavipes]
MADKGILQFVQSSENIIGADSNDENEMNNVAPHSSHIIRNKERHEKVITPLKGKVPHSLRITAAANGLRKEPKECVSPQMEEE